MTETASSAARKGKSAKEPSGQGTQRGGLTMTRIYTTPASTPTTRSRGNAVTW